MMSPSDSPAAARAAGSSADAHRTREHFTTKTLTSRKLFAMAVLVLGVGVSYVQMQWVRDGAIADAIFVSLLVGATLLLLLGLHTMQAYLRNKSLNFYRFVLSTDDPQEAYEKHESLCARVMDVPKMALTGVCYGTVVSSAPFLLGVWTNDLVLRVALAAFLFVANFATGVAFYSLVVFFLYTARMGQSIEVDFWHLDNPSISFIVGATQRIALWTSAYVGISISSILFSVLPFDELVVAYSGFAGILILASLIVPIYPIARKMRTAKEQALYNIDKRLQAAFHDTIDAIGSEEREKEVRQFVSLLELREKIESIQALPFRLKSISAGTSILFFSSVPALLQVLLQQYLG